MTHFRNVPASDRCIYSLNNQYYNVYGTFMAHLWVVNLSLLACPPQIKISHHFVVILMILRKRVEKHRHFYLVKDNIWKQVSEIQCFVQSMNLINVIHDWHKPNKLRVSGKPQCSLRNIVWRNHLDISALIHVERLK